MNNRMYSVFQIVGIAALGIMIVIQVILSFNVSERITAIEQKQVVLEHRMEVLLDNIYALSSSAGNENQ